VSARGLHRGLSVVFSLFVLGNFGAMALGDEALGVVVGGLTLIPLVLLMGTGWALLLRPLLRPRAPDGPA
jgi:hypothetical protein